MSAQLLDKKFLDFSQNSGWAGKHVTINDPVEVELAGYLQILELAHVAGSTSRANVGHWNAFFFGAGLS
jgi:hypothetical protein